MYASSALKSLLAFALLAVFAQARVGTPTGNNGSLAVRHLEDCPLVVNVWECDKCCGTCTFDILVLGLRCEVENACTLEEKEETKVEDADMDLARGLSNCETGSVWFWDTDKCCSAPTNCLFLTCQCRPSNL